LPDHSNGSPTKFPTTLRRWGVDRRSRSFQAKLLAPGQNPRARSTMGR
jgi:hypothetical protein